MLAILKFIQSLASTLHSEGTPWQIALGAALGAALGMTPLMNVHNLVILALLCLLNVSFGAGMLAWAIFVPVGFALDPLFDRLGRALLLDSPSLVPLWTKLDGMPVVPFTNFSNTVVLGSFVAWLALSPFIALGSYYAVVRYRAVLAPRVERWRIYQAVKASKVYNVYSWFRP